MGIFTEGSSIALAEEAFDESLITEFQELCILEDASRAEDSVKEAFKNGDGKILVEAGKMRKKTLVRLGAQDDLTRRETLAAMVLAKRAGDPLWDKLAANRVKEKELLGKIRQKYSTKSAKLAKLGQKDYIKNRMPKGINLNFGANR